MGHRRFEGKFFEPISDDAKAELDSMTLEDLRAKMKVSETARRSSQASMQMFASLPFSSSRSHGAYPVPAAGLDAEEEQEQVPWRELASKS